MAVPVTIMVAQEFTFKIVVLGDGNVGKTSLVSFFTTRSFKDFYLPTIGAQFSLKEMDVEDIHAKLYVWDIAGQAKFSSIRKMFYEKASAALFVFDVTKRPTLDSIPAWQDDLKGVLGEGFPSALVGNKADLIDERGVPSEDAMEVASDLGMLYFETSAKTGQSVDDVFHNIVLLLRDKQGI